jgi:hypothetical protein
MATEAILKKSTLKRTTSHGIEQHPHLHLVERDKPTKSESVGQTLLQLPWKQKRGKI